MIRQFYAFLTFGLFILIITACTLVEDEFSVRQHLNELPYAEELQTALDLALREGQGQYDLGISQDDF